MSQSIEDTIRRELERMGVQDSPETTQERPGAPHTAPQQPETRVPVEAALSAAIGGPLALNDDQTLGRIAGGATATINGRPHTNH